MLQAAELRLPLPVDGMLANIVNQLGAIAGRAAFDTSETVQVLGQFLADDDLHPFGRKIIEACMDNALVSDYERVLEESPF